MKFFRSFRTESSWRIMAMVRSSLQKVMLFLHRVQTVTFTSPGYQKLCKDIQPEIDTNCGSSRRRSRDQSQGFQGISPDENNYTHGNSIFPNRDCVELHSESGAKLMTLQEELWFWAKLKDEELTRQSTTGDDINNLPQQQDYCMTVQRQFSPRRQDSECPLKQVYLLPLQHVDTVSESNVKESAEFALRESSMWLAQAVLDEAMEVQHHFSTASLQQQVSWVLRKLQDLQDAMHQLDLGLAEMENKWEGWCSEGQTLVSYMPDGFEESVSELLRVKNSDQFFF